MPQILRSVLVDLHSFTSALPDSNSSNAHIASLTAPRSSRRAWTSQHHHHRHRLLLPTSHRTGCLACRVGSRAAAFSSLPFLRASRRRGPLVQTQARLAGLCESPGVDGHVRVHACKQASMQASCPADSVRSALARLLPRESLTARSSSPRRRRRRRYSQSIRSANQANKQMSKQASKQALDSADLGQFRRPRNGRGPPAQPPQPRRVLLSSA